MKFRIKLKCGSHTQDGKKYIAGDTIESNVDLAKIFPFKFVKIEGIAPVNEDVAPPDIPMLQEEGKEDSASKSLEPSFPEVETQQSNATIPLPSETKEEEIKEEESEYGKDVTAKFPSASKVKLKVYVKSNWYSVVDPDDGEVLNEKKLRKRAVTEFLKDYLEEDVDADDGEEEE